MTDRNVELAIGVIADADDAIRSFADVQDAARKLRADDVEEFVRDANRSLDGLRDGLDQTASTASMAAGGLGDLAGGLELAGFDGAAAKLEQGAVAIQTIAGVADLATVATNLLSVSKIKDTAATVANKTASIAASAATKAMAAAQWLLNAALSANPIGLIILAVVALVAGFVLLYKKSDTFRAIVDKVGKVGREAIGWIVDKVGDLVEWVKDKAPAAFDKLKRVAIFAINHIPIVWIIRKLIELVGWVKDRLPAAWDWFKTKAVQAFNAIPIVFLIRKAGDLYDWVKVRLPGAWDVMRRVAVDAFDKITAPIRGLIDWVDDLIDKISDIDWPEPPDWVKDLGGAIGDVFSKTTVLAPALTTGADPFAPVETRAVSQDTYNFKISGILDSDQAAEKIEELLKRRRKRLYG